MRRIGAKIKDFRLSRRVDGGQWEQVSFSEHVELEGDVLGIYAFQVYKKERVWLDEEKVEEFETANGRVLEAV